MTDQPSSIFSDLALSRRLERAEARSSVEFVEARAGAFPTLGAGWVEVGGTYALFDGPDSPCTQTFGLGMFEPASDADMALIEVFFNQHGAPVLHEVSPLADESALAVLNARGYEPFEFTSILFREIAAGVPTVDGALLNEAVTVRKVGAGERELWAQIAARGWSETPELAEFVLGMSQVNALKPSGHSFLAEVGGEAIAAGGLSLHDGVALLAGASTVPEGRRQGAQLALLDARLRHAAEQGCDLAMMGALPGSASQRNAERHGFRIAYTRVKWRQRGVTYTASLAS